MKNATKFLLLGFLCLLLAFIFPYYPDFKGHSLRTLIACSIMLLGSCVSFLIAYRYRNVVVLLLMGMTVCVNAQKIQGILPGGKFIKYDYTTQVLSTPYGETKITRMEKEGNWVYLYTRSAHNKNGNEDIVAVIDRKRNHYSSIHNKWIFNSFKTVCQCVE